MEETLKTEGFPGSCVVTLSDTNMVEFWTGVSSNTVKSGPVPKTWVHHPTTQNSLVEENVHRRTFSSVTTIICANTRSGVRS